MDSSMYIGCRYYWFGFRWARLEWWAASCYLIGVAAYTTSSITSIIGDCIHLDPTLQVGLIFGTTCHYRVLGRFTCFPGDHASLY